MNSPVVDENSSTNEAWVVGDNFGLSIPADPDALLEGGTEFLTYAFRASGQLAENNRVVSIVDSAEFFDGGSGKKLQMTVEYEKPNSALPNRLFVKFSRNFDNALWDSAKHMMLSEVNFALLSRSPDFPVKVPLLMFGDLESESETGLLITELIPYGEGNVEIPHPKCMDYLMDNADAVDHYRAIFASMGRLSGAHRAGKLSPEFDELFGDAEAGAAQFRSQASDDHTVQRAQRMFDFIERYPKLFPDHFQEAGLREEFLSFMADGFAARPRIQEILQSGRPKFVAFSHWNGNIDNCWFERQPDGSLVCGFIDWANCGVLPFTQVVSGALGCAEPSVWAENLDELLSVFIQEFEAQGVEKLSREELSLHVRLSLATNFGISMAAPVAVARDIEDIDAVSGPRDPIFRDLYTSRVMLFTMTNLIENWKNLNLGELVRKLR